jgi:hypothetical protein
VVLGEVLVQV